MKITARFSPRAIREGEELDVVELLEAGDYAKCPGLWRVLDRTEGERLGVMRQFVYAIEPLDDVARATADAAGRQ